MVCCYLANKGGNYMKNLTKYFVALMLIISTVTIGNTISTYASTWTLVDSKTTSASTSPQWVYLNGVKAGNAKICLKDEFGGMRISVYDNDGGTPTSGPRIYDHVFIGNNECLIFDAKPYIDGTDNDAEFVIAPTRGSVSSFIFQLWD